MDSKLVAFASVALAAATAAVAHADSYYGPMSGPPSLTPPMAQQLEPPPAPPLPDQYVSFGAIAGVDNEGIFFDPEVEVGRRISGSLWAHAIAFGGDNDSSTWGDGPLPEDKRLEFGGGLELRPCMGHGSVCLDAGADVAYRIHHTETDGVDAVDNVTATVVLEHLGMDIGAREWRFRASTVMTSDASGVFAGLGVTAGVVYTW